MPLKPLRLLAQSSGDVPIISALLQDAVLKPEDLHYNPRARRLVMLVNRYRWEDKTLPTRVRAGVRIESVLQVQRQAWPTATADTVLDLLSLTAESAENETTVLTLAFAGGAGLRITAECVDIIVEDVTQAWAARLKPRHDA